MKLDIISPEEIVYSGDVDLVTLPGTLGSFTVFLNHAPIISSLEKGRLRYMKDGKDVEMIINGGFVEMKNNVINVCIEQILKPIDE